MAFFFVCLMAVMFSSAGAQAQSDSRAVSRMPRAAADTTLDLTKLDSLLAVAQAEDTADKYRRPGITNPPKKLEPPEAAVVQGFADGDYWMLREDLVWNLRREGRKLSIPSGFVTDYASIPKAFHSVLGKTGPYSDAAVIHDYYYWVGESVCSREQADNIMARAMNESGVGRHTAKLIYRAVRVAGQSAWDANARDREAGLIRTVPGRLSRVPPATRWKTYRQKLKAEGVPEKFTDTMELRHFCGVSVESP